MLIKIETKTTSAIFLAFVLVTGTIAAISPSFFIKGVNAQGDSYYGGMDYSYYDKKSYGMDDSYDKKPVYGMDDSYDKKPVYGMDSYGEEESYGNERDHGMDSYGEEESYGNNDYKSQYQSYGKDDSRDKSSKDSKKSVSINKLKCINTNLNVNGNNAGNVSIGNKGQGSSDGYSSADGRYGGDDGYSKKHKDAACIINNNNNNTNITTGGGVPGGDGNITEADCAAGVACFVSTLNPTQLGNLKFVLGLPVDAPNELLCTVIDDLSAIQLRAAITAPVVGVTQAVATVIINCLIDAGFSNLAP